MPVKKSSSRKSTRKKPSSRKQHGGSAPDSVAMPAIQQAPQLNEKEQRVDAPHYTYTKILPLSGGQTLSFGVGSTQDLYFEIPGNSVNNLAQSLVSYQMQISEQGAGKFIHVPADTVPELYAVQYNARGSTPIVDIQYANNYLKMSRKINTTKAEFDDMIQEDCLYKSNLPASQNPSAAPAVYQAAGAAGGIPVNASVNFTEPQYIKTSLVAGTGAAGVGTWPTTGATQLRQIRLGYFKGTFFEIDKDECFPQTMVLKLTFSGSKCGWSGTSNINPATGAAALTGTITMSQLCLYVQTETREDIIKSRIAQSTSGKELSVPYLYYARVPGNGGSQAIQTRMTGTYGSYCRQMMFAPFAGSEVANYIFDHSNLTAASGLAAGGGKVLSYFTTLDNKKQQQFSIGCVPPNLAGASVGYPSDDYLLNKKSMIGSVIQSQDMYRLNWVHIENYLGQPSQLDEKGEGLIGAGGLHLAGAGERLHTFYAETIAADSAAATLTLNWYVFFICTKKLKISKDRVVCE